MPVEWEDEDALKATRRAALRGLIAGGNLLRNEALRLIQHTEKSGRLYARRGIQHRASAPGEPPASDTGTLVSLISVEVDPDTLTVKVVCSADYAEALEFGTVKMEARPFMRPATENMRDAIEERVAWEIEKETGV